MDHSPLKEPGRRGGGPHQGVMRTPSPKFQRSTAGEQDGHCGSAFLLDEEHLRHQNEVPSATVTKHHRLVGVREESPPSLTSGGLESEARCGQSLTPSKGSRKGRFVPLAASGAPGRRSWARGHIAIIPVSVITPPSLPLKTPVTGFRTGPNPG